MQDVLIGLIAGFGYFIESVFGFGGTVVFIGISGFFFDFKTLIYISMLVSCVASLAILLQTWRHFSLHHFKRTTLVALPTLLLGTYLMESLASPWLLKGFAVMLVFYGLHGLAFPSWKPPTSMKYGFVALGGFIQGVFTTGGPFVLMGYRTAFADKTQLKSTMAAFFLVCNIVRVIQTTATGNGSLDTLIDYSWTCLPVIIGVWLGHKLHVRIPERVFQVTMLSGLSLIGVLLLLK